MKPKRKIISLLLCAAMLLSFCPTSVFAEAPAQDGGVAIGASGGSVQYIVRSWNGSEVTEETKDISDYTEITSSNPPKDWSGNTNGGWYVVTGTVEIADRITVTGNVHLILTDNCTLTASKGICVNEGNSLTIYATSEGESMGKLTTTGEDYTAGIGGNRENTGGTITIHGGEITATGIRNAAGIGGGWYGSGGNISIYGGTVTTEGGGGNYGGAGIGGGGGSNKTPGGDGGIISIYGGTVSATGGQGKSSSDGAGIGGGYKGDGGTINIYGGDIKAESRNGAGIGGGGPRTPDDTMIGGSGGKITITGGKVTAKSTNGAGIGGGMEIDDRAETYVF